MAFTLLGISGSLRDASTNTMLVRTAFDLAGDGVDARLADIDLPLFNEDVEAKGYPASVEAFVEAIRAADAIVISTPEYNKNLSGVLKNALDWQSRFRPGPLTGKPVALLSCTAGGAGGEQAQRSLRACLTPFAPKVVQQPQAYVGGNTRDGLFADGRVADDATRDAIAKVMTALREMAG